MVSIRNINWFIIYKLELLDGFPMREGNQDGNHSFAVKKGEKKKKIRENIFSSFIYIATQSRWKTHFHIEA